MEPGKKIKVFLTAWIIKLCTHLSDHHSPIREGQVYNKHIGRSSKGLDLKEDIDHTAIAKKADEEQEEIGNPYQVISQGVLWGELGPMLVYNIQGSPVQSIQLAGSLAWHKNEFKYKAVNSDLWIVEVIKGIHIDSISRIPGHDVPSPWSTLSSNGFNS